MGLQVKLDKRIREGVCIITCAGSIDTSTYLKLENELEQAAHTFPQTIILELNGVDYVSSIGISSILKTKKIMQERKGALIIANLQPQVKKVFDIIKVLPTQAVFKDTAELDAYLYKMQKKELEKDKPLL